MKTSDLTGAALNWAVAKCEFPEPDLAPITWLCYITEGVCDRGWVFKPSADWAQAGPIIEREGVGLMKTEMGSGEWEACKWIDPDKHMPLIECGPTPLIAAMRCYVASRLGDEVDIPEELTGVAA